MTDFKKYEVYFKNLLGNSNFGRLGKTFKTECKYYYYDMGTGKVLECEKNVYVILEHLEKGREFSEILNLGLDEDAIIAALEIIKNAAEDENILQAPEVTSLQGPMTLNLKQYVNHGLKQLTLELTQRCNLRCEYCIYQQENEKFRGFSEADDMTFETVKTAVDYLVQHGQEKEIFITFYGGEPLLRFDLIKQCIEYVKSLNLGKKVFYNMTSNLTLVTPEIAKYIASIPDFTVLCSIDGPEEIHDEFRKKIDGTGSFNQTIRGLKYLSEAFKERRYTHILINSVISPPYTDEKFNKMQKFFAECPYITNEMNISYSYVDTGEPITFERYKMRREQIEKEELEEWNPLLLWERKNNTFKNFQKLKDTFTWITHSTSLALIHQRTISDKPYNFYEFNGCCVPGSRRIYVTSDGKIKVCEQVGEAPYIGDLKDGIDLEAIKKIYVDDYLENSMPDCSNCWAVHFCGICYARCYGKDGINIAEKKYRCLNEREMVKNSLIDYHELLENNPEALKELDYLE